MVKSDQIVQMTRSYLSFRIVISGIFFIIIGLALIVMNYFSNKANDKYKVWKCDDIGVITNTDIQETTSRRKVNQRYVYITEYIPYIVYKYKVNGVEYRNNKISVKKKNLKLDMIVSYIFQIFNKKNYGYVTILKIIKIHI